MRQTIISAALLAAAITTSNASITFTDDFNTDPLDAGWSNVVGSDYTQAGGVLTATTTVGVNSITTHGGVVSTIAPFSMTVDFKFDAQTGTENWPGLVFNSGGTGLGAESALDYIVFRVRGSNGRVTISRFDDNATQFNLALSNGGAGSSTPPGDIGALVSGNTYRLTLTADATGFYTGTVIDVDGGDGGSPGGTLITISNTIAETTLVGGEFGIYSRNVGDGELHYDDFSVTATSPVAGFNSWAAGFGIPNDENDDSDLDGIPALVEYGLGYDPTVFNSMPLPVPSGADHTVTWPKGSQAAGDPEISYAPEVSTDLVTWNPPAPGDLTESATELVLTLTGGQQKIFARLEVIRTP